MDSKNGIVIQSGYFQASSAHRKHTMMPIVKTMLIGNKEISVFGALPCVEQDDTDSLDKLVERTLAKNNPNSILQAISNLCGSIRTRTAKVSTAVCTNSGVVVVLDGNQMYISYWNQTTIIVVSSGRKPRLLPSNAFFKNGRWLSETKEIQSTRIDLNPEDEYVLVANDRLLQYLTLEGIVRMVNRLLRKNCSVESIAESLVKATTSLGHRGELIVHLLLLRKPEWLLDISVHGGSIYNTVNGFLPRCSHDYMSCDFSDLKAAKSHKASCFNKENALEKSASLARYRSSSSIEKREGNLQSEDCTDSAALHPSKDDVDDSFLKLIKGNDHVVS